MKPAAVKPVAEGPNDTFAVDDDTKMATVKRSKRLIAKRTFLDVSTAADVTGEQPEENAKKRQRRTRSATIAKIKKSLPEGVFELSGASGLAGAAEKKRKVTTKTGDSTGIKVTAVGLKATGTTAAKSSSSSEPRRTARRKRETTSGTTAATGEGDGSDDGDVGRQRETETGGATAASETDDGSSVHEVVVARPTAGAEPTRGHGPGNTFERDVRLLSKRFAVRGDELAVAIERDAIPVFRRRFSGHVAPAAITVSPVVATSTGTDRRRRGGVGYAIEPARCSAARGAPSLKRLMDELTKTMPSWCLHVVAEPPWYVISRTTVDAYGTPAVDRSVVLDGQLRASVYVDGRLRHEHAKRYGTATEIVNLVKVLDDVAPARDDGTTV